MTRTLTPRTRPQRRARAARRAAALVASLAAALLPGLAQAQQASLQVQLRDAATGEPVAGVTVKLSNAAIGFRRAVVTDANGQAILNGLSMWFPYQGTCLVYSPGTLTDNWIRSS
jgi:TctA family transporter